MRSCHMRYGVPWEIIQTADQKEKEPLSNSMRACVHAGEEAPHAPQIRKPARAILGKLLHAQH
jgi:hypothetical protein